MSILSPSIIRLERPIMDCARLLNGLGCESVHVDVCQGLAFPGFFSLEEVQSGSLNAFKACVTMHLFRLPGDSQIDLSFLRKTDLAALHMFPHTTADDVLKFFETIQLSGCRPGLSIDLNVDLSTIKDYLAVLDTILIMSIPVATFGFMPDKTTIDRLANASQLIAEYNPLCRLGLDGGVNATTFPQMITWVDELVVGSLLLDADDIVTQWASLTSLAKGGRNGSSCSS